MIFIDLLPITIHSNNRKFVFNHPTNIFFVVDGAVVHEFCVLLATVCVGSERGVNSIEAILISDQIHFQVDIDFRPTIAEISKNYLNSFTSSSLHKFTEVSEKPSGIETELTMHMCDMCNKVSMLT